MKRFLIFVAVIAAVFCAIGYNVRIVRIGSGSISYKYCLCLLGVEPQKGDLCVLRKGNLRLVKYVAGVEGDRVSSIKDVICINYDEVGILKKNASLTPIKSQTIPEGYVFVIGEHEDSFDSRYEGFGLVKTSDIEGKGIGLWK